MTKPLQVPREIASCPQCGGIIVVRLSQDTMKIQGCETPISRAEFKCLESHDLNVQKDPFGGVIPNDWTEAVHRIVDWIETIEEAVDYGVDHE